MSVQVENLEKNMAKLTIEVPAEELEKALEKAYQKQKKNISVPGFRKGKVPRAMVEKMYGPAVFYEDAVNSLVPEEYSKAAEESKLDIVSRPEINVEQIEKGKAFIFTATVAVKPEVTLGEYKGLEVAKADTTVTDEEVEAELKKEQEKNARTINVEDRPAADGDTVTLDFEGSVDGVPFDGGAGKDYPQERVDLVVARVADQGDVVVVADAVAAAGPLDEFEEQLVGAALEEEKEVNVTFPEDYQAEELAGKAAVFKCTIHKIEAKELPALDDDFAKDVSEFDTLDEYKKEIKDNLTKKKEEQAKTEKENAVVDKAVENATMEIPEAMIEEYENRIINIHPSLIPSFCGTGYYGLKVHEAALARGVKLTGATVHYVDKGTDTGPILLQKAVEVKPEDTPEILQRRVMEEAEWKLLPAAINMIANGEA